MHRTYIIPAFALCFIGITFGQIEKKYISQGNSYYRDSLFNLAQEKYSKALEIDEKNEKAVLNIGNTMYRMDSLDKARDFFEQIINDDKYNSIIKSKAYHNLGNVFLKKQELKSSLKAYKNALKQEPGNESSRYNYFFVKQLLKSQPQQQQQEQQQNDKQDSNSENENQQKSESEDQDTDNTNENNKQEEKQESSSEDNAEKENNTEQNDNNQNGEDNPENNEQENATPREAVLSKEEAEQLLDAFINDQKRASLEEESKKRGIKVSSDKDW